MDTAFRRTCRAVKFENESSGHDDIRRRKIPGAVNIRLIQNKSVPHTGVLHCKNALYSPLNPAAVQQRMLVAEGEILDTSTCSAPGVILHSIPAAVFSDIGWGASRTVSG